MLAVLPVILAYLVGAIPFALVVGRLAGIGDIRKLGSGNIGATNVWRVAGFKTALWVFIGDIGKGVLAVLVGRWYVENFSLTFVSADLFLVVCAADQAEAVLVREVRHGIHLRIGHVTGRLERGLERQNDDPVAGDSVAASVVVHPG